MNFGIRTGEFSKVVVDGKDVYLHAFDVDTAAGCSNDDLLRLMRDEFGYVAGVTVRTGGSAERGHCYFLLDRPIRGKVLAKLPSGNLELAGTGRQIVAVGSTHPDTGRQYRWVDGEMPNFRTLPVRSADRIETYIDLEITRHLPGGREVIGSGPIADLDEDTIRFHLWRILQMADERGNWFAAMTADVTIIPGVTSLADPVSEEAKALVRWVRQHRPPLVVIDTLERGFSGLDEKDSREMSAALGFVQSLVRAGAGFVLLIHHPLKDGNLDTPRGSGSLFAAADVSIALCHGSRKGEIVVSSRGRKTKHRSTDILERLVWHREELAFGVDQWGDGATLAIVRRGREAPSVVLFDAGEDPSPRRTRADLDAEARALAHDAVTLRAEGALPDVWRVVDLAEAVYSGTKGDDGWAPHQESIRRQVKKGVNLGLFTSQPIGGRTRTEHYVIAPNLGHFEAAPWIAV